MLASLTIRDVVLIDRLTLCFRSGLSVLTGETGAGKSILLDALGLALGARAEARFVRAGADKAVVTAEFILPSDHAVYGLLAELGLATADSLILRRTLGCDGRSRAFINDQPVGIGILRQAGDLLVEVHGQFESHGLLDARTHRDVLDAFGGLIPHATRVAQRYRAWQVAEQAYANAMREAERAHAEEDYLRHAAAELDELAPETGEETRLAERRGLLMHREKVLEAVNAALTSLTGDRGADGRLASALRSLTRIADKAGGALDTPILALERAEAEMADAAHRLTACAEGMDLDPGDLDRLEERLFALRAVARKHGVTVDRLPALRETLARRLADLDTETDRLGALAADAREARRAYQAEAEQLSRDRAAAVLRLDEAVARELPPLKLDRALFQTTQARLSEKDWGAAGLDRIGFTVATNPGAAPGPLNKIASGGELARFMLALKVVLARTSSAPTLVFDEVDAGVGGAVAAAVGERLQRLGEDVQVLVVTHSPQVAARGGQHLQVRKTPRDGDARGGGVATDVRELSDPERHEEIARMLSGARVTDEARSAARALMGEPVG